MALSFVFELVDDVNMLKDAFIVWYQALQTEYRQQSRI